MYDMYKKDVPGLADPANNMFSIVPSDDTDLPCGIKALRIWNPNETTANVTVTTVIGDQVMFPVPALSLWTEPLRCTRIHSTGTSAGLILHGYTDGKVPK